VEVEVEMERSVCRGKRVAPGDVPQGEIKGGPLTITPIDSNEAAMPNCDGTRIIS
jgi:hypothetical protein